MTGSVPVTGGDGAEAGLATAAWLADHHGRAWTDDAARARLPRGEDTRRPEILSQALASAGLRGRMVTRRPDRIDPATLPAILFDFEGTPFVLARAAKGRFQIVETALGGLESDLTARELRHRARRVAMLVTPQDRAEDSDSGPSGHWFWRPMRENRWAWVQIVIAALAVNVLALAMPIFVMNVYDRVIPNLAFVTLTTLALGVGLAVTLDFALRSVRAGVLERIGRRLDVGVSASLFRHALGLRPGDMPGGALGTATFLRDFDTVREFFGSQSLVALIDLVFIGIFIAVLWLIVGPLAFVPLIAIPIMLALAIGAQIPMGNAVARAQSAANRRQKVLIEALAGLETVKTLNAEPVMQKEWDAATAAAARVSGRSRFWSNFASNGTMVIQQGVSIGIITWGVFLIADGRISIGALIAANILSGRALAPLGAIAQTVFRAQYARRAMRSISELMAVPAERGDTISSPLTVAEGRVATQALSFTYPGSLTPAVSDLTLDIAPGEIVALVGRVGSGKSTLGKLLCGLLAPGQGTILIDGQNATQYDPAELRRGVGYLPQEPELFTGTLGENLTIGAPRATPEDIARALSLSGMDSFVASLPNGLGTFIGERGGNLSGGQRQGVALARLILRRPPVLFLDEPTNAMDRDMESQVTERLSALRDDGIALILCTHRPGLAALAGRMVVMDRGRKVLDGPSQEVLGTLKQAALTHSQEAR
ncbi:type I secretion system permease/ATPase [Maritimibacter sp. UBA3975]|uniref:type I secretion system permease/ATPase n=1 Tax=Maritimibacter sp. UBA3975 TaxID=1946833 RepID=UPI000C08F484|nr:type I secretion system permease/ATPase [Maritimibacter sp. UBA3975]MAM62311.1 type I secretion system permease/ATPase [Maritimibacter sp.]|tara:strand:+ start:12196 stop:14334 length:2139 start_codon:yes stop_codon:yes gene_type:complete